jgi:ribosomally synthesized peptide (two-chain TOMM family)
MSWCIPVNMQGDGSSEAVAAAAGVAEGLGADFRPGSLESSLHWQVIWPRVIAKAWEDDEFHAEVMANPHEAIKKHFGYVLSENLDLKIEDAPATATFEPEENSPYTPDDPWSKLPPLRLTVVIPPAPDPSLQAVAITAYQDTGRTYPFTCC